jgi:hypothetical protein
VRATWVRDNPVQLAFRPGTASCRRDRRTTSRLSTANPVGPADGGRQAPPLEASIWLTVLFRYRTGCGAVYGHTGNFLGYTQFAAASSDGRRSATVSTNIRLTQQAGGAVRPLRRAFVRAACAALASPGARPESCPALARPARRSTELRAASGRCV